MWPDGIPNMLTGIPFLKINVFPFLRANWNSLLFILSGGRGCWKKPFKIIFNNKLANVPIIQYINWFFRDHNKKIDVIIKISGPLSPISSKMVTSSPVMSAALTHDTPITFTFEFDTDIKVVQKFNTELVPEIILVLDATTGQNAIIQLEK